MSAKPTRALSIRAPWWWFILHAGKDIENRDWPTGFRGTVYVHASKWYVHRDVVDDLWFGIERALPGLSGKVMAQGHPHEFLRAFGGRIVGTVDIVDCVTESDSPWFFGRYGFVLAMASRRSFRSTRSASTTSRGTASVIWA